MEILKSFLSSAYNLLLNFQPYLYLSYFVGFEFAFKTINYFSNNVAEKNDIHKPFLLLLCRYIMKFNNLYCKIA